MAKTRLSAREVLNDIRSGCDDAFLMDKYNLSHRGLQSLFRKLIDKGIITQEELDERIDMDRSRLKGEWTCPACGSQQTSRLERCPECGAAVGPSDQDGRREIAVSGDRFTLSEPSYVHFADQAVSTGRKLAATGTSQAKKIAGDLREMDFAKEILPIDDSNIVALKKDVIFWSVSFLGIVPLMICTFRSGDSQITLFSLFFALIWGVIFKRQVMRDSGDWKLAAAGFLFTAIAGTPLLLAVYRLMPSFYLNLARSDNSLASLFGFVFQVGMWEELCKTLPVLIYIGWQRATKRFVDQPTVLVIAVFSGLAFAAFENVDYAKLSVLKSLQLTEKYGSDGLSIGVRGAMINVLLRSLSLVFCHAVWSGIFAYFLAVAAKTGRRWGALFIVGLGLSALLHGIYDWFCGLSLTVAALTAGVSFMLFYAYVTKLVAGPAASGPESLAVAERP